MTDRRRPTIAAAARMSTAALALLAVSAAAAEGQQTGSLTVRATVVATAAPRLEVALAAAPVAAPVRVAGGERAVEVTAALLVRGNAGYRVLARAAERAEGQVLVRDASGAYRPLRAGEVVEVGRGTAGEGVSRDVAYRVHDARSAAAVPVVYEIVYDPVT